MTNYYDQLFLLIVVLDKIAKILRNINKTFWQGGKKMTIVILLALICGGCFLTSLVLLPLDIISWLHLPSWLFWTVLVLMFAWLLE